MGNSSCNRDTIMIDLITRCASKMKGVVDYLYIGGMIPLCMVNKWEEEFTCNIGYRELTAMMGVDKTGIGAEVMIQLCVDKIEPFKYELDELSSRHLENIIKTDSESIGDFYAWGEFENDLNKSGIETVRKKNKSFVQLEKESTLRCFQDDNCFIDYYIPLD